MIRGCVVELRDTSEVVAVKVQEKLKKLAEIRRPVGVTACFLSLGKWFGQAKEKSELEVPSSLEKPQ